MSTIKLASDVDKPLSEVWQYGLDSSESHFVGRVEGVLL